MSARRAVWLALMTKRDPGVDPAAAMDMLLDANLHKDHNSSSQAPGIARI